MDISSDSAQLLERESFLSCTPNETLDILRYGSDQDYVDKLANLALDSRYTSTIFTTHEAFFVEICSIWLTRVRADSAIDPVAIVLALTRVLPLAPHLAVYAKELLFRQQPGILHVFSSRSAMALVELPESCLSPLLLALFRLLRFDNEEFAVLISPVQLQLLLSHSQYSVRYLAIRILCLYLHASDAAMEKMIENYCSQEQILGSWEHLNIDYAFLTLWEEKMMGVLTRELQNSRSIDKVIDKVSVYKREIDQDNLSSSTACLGEVLVPMLNERPSEVSSLIMTKTFIRNKSNFAHAINEQRPVLLMGPPGCGKTSLVKKVAEELGQNQAMITLHLNEQTDAKLLIGMYVSAGTPGSFKWQAGVLTKAVMEGRWVIIEDLDRAPTEILSTILPLLERRELLVPHWGETIRPTSNFNLIATIRTKPNVQGEEAFPESNMLGIRHWLRVPLFMPGNEELAEIVECKYPILRAYVQKIIRVYCSIGSMLSNMRAKLISQRQVGPRNLYRWCSRLQDLLSTAGVRTGNEPISDILNDMILLEAVDCFAGHLAGGATKSSIVEVISQELHVPAMRSKYCLEVRKPEYVVGDATLRIGRTCISKKMASQAIISISPRSWKIPFATTSQVLRIMESIAITVKMAEPCLLVGETGTGKTTLIQQLAELLGYKLNVINLSQQSEASDLLGGFKPLSIRALAVPMQEEFDVLFESTFSSKRNQKYVHTIGKAVSKGRWARALKLWKEALKLVQDSFGSNCSAVDRRVVEPRQKRRKLETPKNLKLKRRWDGFASSVRTFQMHLASDSNGFAFSFVEGQIVQAAKNGDWILLDEINLASQDTLESLADLISNGIDDVPTLLLPETGDTERIQAHKDFRIFGAMNPATDVGKRDLPSSIRSRFTEIYLDHPDRNYDDLVLIVKAYLGNHNNLDLRAAADISHLYLEIHKLVEENRLVDGANQMPHFSLRTLTRTLIYVTDIISVYGLRRALYEGFSMSFLTLLNKESELLLVPLIHKYILGSSKNAGSFIQQVPRAPQNGTGYVQFRHYWIVRGAAPTCQQPHYIITPFVERNLLNLVRATSTRRFPVLLQGPTSSGKTSMIEYLARISGNRCMRINNHEHTDLQEYLGSYVSGPDGRLQYQEGILVRALREGHWIILDELNLAPTDVLEALNRLLDDNKELLVPEIQQVIKPHESFMLFATQNPPGMYGGRKMLSRAFKNRFLELHFDDIPEDELETILRERSQIAPSFCAKIVAVYKKLSIFRQRDRLFDQKNSFATLRDLFRWALRDADDREQLAINGFLLLAERVRNPDESLVVKKIIEDVMKISINVAQIYGANSSFMASISSLPCSQEIVWTKSMRRLYALVSQALRRNEPVLLVGETGSGKTTICQVIAAAMKKKLHIVNAHQNMETGDLIGAQRPVRNRAAISTTLVQDLIRILKSHMRYEEILSDDLSSLLNAYDAFVQESPSSLSNQERTHIEQNRTRLATLFEWSDGSLVHAMRNGQYFLLDEISLADDSVLERLNSVLESDRTLLLAEQGSTNNLIPASDGFQFLATMNPGGDFGKRELSPALRNRFTEIWVPPATDCEEMFQIAEAKLSASFLKYSSPMIGFAEWYSTTFSPITPNVSIRELLAWIQFVNSYSGPSPYEALLHGAAMVYIDGLGANPAARVRVSEADVHQQRQECLMKLSLLFDHDMESIYKREINISLAGDKICFGSFCLETVNQTTENLGYHLETPTTKANAMKIVRALQLQRPVLLEGNPGVGKSTIVIALAGLAGVPLTRINLSDQTDLMDLFGSDVPVDDAQAGNFGWRDAPFLRAMQKGEWVLLDEMNLASQTVLEGLNSCLDHRGQVYISELDQTFTRHPRFTVFAAQNPHQQGGGRKGLPASFVNRFTTVYTDAFTALDLLTICSQCYPQHAAQSIQSLVHCVTDLSYVLHTNNEISAHGGPWEINLRDLFRWLSLLDSDGSITSAGNAVDYEDLLIVQRFRNIGSVAAVLKVLEKHMPQARRTPSFVHNMTSNYLQVGFAFIERDHLIKPSIDRRIQQVSVNLRLVESALLCIKKNWPCLLVGPSGSGKTSLIMQLANYIGAEIVNLPLNADMDTMDLIGGYEQLDFQRERVSLLKKLSQTTRSLIVDHLASTSDAGFEILMLEEKLRAELPDMEEIVDLSRRLGSHYPKLCYSSIAAECEKISHQSSEDNRARFEWVDGLLVKALKQGQWLVLDNANLCNSSILDRLNALLEPNGLLSINEHRTSDGRAHIVTPHPDFRLFFTINPQHGELSRAMRNRCIEIYMPAEGSGSGSLKPLGTAYEPSLSHFQVFETVDWTAPNHIHLHEMSSLCADFLTFSDYVKCRRWEGELAKGLLGVPHMVQALIVSELNVRHEILKSEGNTVRRIHTIYEELAMKAKLPPDFEIKQVSSYGPRDVRFDY
jgi:midasin